MRPAFSRRDFGSWVGLVVGVWILALVGAASRVGAIASTMQSQTFVREVLAPALPDRPSV
jgi:hypothetical protein